MEMIAEAGFDGINGFIPSPEEEKRWNKLLERYRLSLIVNAYSKTCNDMAILLKKAKQYGASSIYRDASRTIRQVLPRTVSYVEALEQLRLKICHITS